MNPISFKDLLIHTKTSPGLLGLRASIAMAISSGSVLAYVWYSLNAGAPWRGVPRGLFLLVAAFLSLLSMSMGVSAATAFATERDRETLEPLVVSPVSTWKLVWGKLLSSLVIGWAAQAPLVPALALTLALGGATPGTGLAYLLLLSTWQVTFAAYALRVSARRLRAPTQRGIARVQPNQTQLALQNSVGMATIPALIPIYLALVWIPMSGNVSRQWLDDLAPLGVFHPILALLAWGDATIWGIRAPLWVWSVLYSSLLVLPMVSDTVHAQRGEGAAPTRTTRTLLLPWLLLTAGIVLSVAQACSPFLATSLVVGFSWLVVLSVSLGVSFGDPTQSPRVSRARVFQSLSPLRALEGAPDRGLGFSLAIAAAMGALVLWVARGLPTAWGCAAAWLLLAAALATSGARLLARDQAQDDRAFLDLARRTAAGEEVEEEIKDARPGPNSWMFWFLTLGCLLPLTAWAGLRWGNGSARGALEFVLWIGAAINPLAGAATILSDTAVVDTPHVADWLRSVGLSPMGVWSLHVAFYASLTLWNLIRLTTPPSLEDLLAQERELSSHEELSPVEGASQPNPATPRPDR